MSQRVRLTNLIKKSLNYYNYTNKFTLLTFYISTIILFLFLSILRNIYPQIKLYVYFSIYFVISIA